MEQQFLRWMEAYAVGHEGLDAEHRRLAVAINEIHAAERAGQNPSQVGILLDAFRCAAEDHLEHENLAMREVGDRANRAKANQLAFLKAMSDAVIDEHIAEHAQSLQKLNLVMRAFHSGANLGERALSDILKDWFVDHAIKYDAHLKAVFQAI